MTVDTPRHAHGGPYRAGGYSDNDKLLAALEWVTMPTSGSYQSTALDVANWDCALSGDSILKENTRRQMWTPITLSEGSTSQSGLGWGLGPFQKRRRISHSGGLDAIKPASAAIRTSIEIDVRNGLRKPHQRPVLVNKAAYTRRPPQFAFDHHPSQTRTPRAPRPTPYDLNANT
jgi:hypothetical protein